MPLKCIPDGIRFNLFIFAPGKPMKLLIFALFSASLIAQTITPTGNFVILSGGYHSWTHVSIQGTFQVVCTDTNNNPVEMRTRYLSPTITIIGPNLQKTVTINCSAVTGGGGGNSSTYTQKFFGTTDPGAIAGNLPGDLYSNYVGYQVFQCNAPPGTPAPACTSVATGQWTLLNGGTGPISLSWSTLTSSQWSTLTSSQWSTLTR